MTLKLIAPGRGEERDAVIVAHMDLMAFPSVMRRYIAAAPEAMICTLTGPAFKKFYASPPPLANVLDWLTKAAGALGVRRIILAGHSEGTQAVRSWLRTGATPDAVIASDGTHASSKPDVATQILPWKNQAARARRCASVFIASHTHIVPDGYMSTTETMRMISGWPLTTAPDRNRDGDFVVYSYPGKDAAAHHEQAREILPRMIEEAFAMLDERDEPTRREIVPPALPAFPWQDRSVSLGERCVRFSLAELDAGVCELPHGSNTSPRIREYLAPCARRATGQMLGLTAAEWCAAAACFAQRECLLPGEAGAHGYFAAGFEIEQSAQSVGTWRAARSGYQPQRGDLAIFKRGAALWMRHVCRVETVPDSSGAFRTIGGNEDSGWRLTPRHMTDSQLLGFVALP